MKIAELRPTKSDSGSLFDMEDDLLAIKQLRLCHQSFGVWPWRRDHRTRHRGHALADRAADREPRRRPERAMGSGTAETHWMETDAAGRMETNAAGQAIGEHTPAMATEGRLRPPFFVRGTGADLVAGGAAQSRHCRRSRSAAVNN
jgi:hypothetical protein